MTAAWPDTDAVPNKRRVASPVIDAVPTTETVTTAVRTPVAVAVVALDTDASTL